MTPTVSRSLDLFATRRLRRMEARGPRCPDCAGPLVHGEGCNVCPVCGFSACETGRA
ncbi:MAG: hypothetical protein WC211_11560 [Dehalococcoidia bacterium]|jgi:uncharacterized Zn finger protein (UPF0148 family)